MELGLPDITGTLHPWLSIFIQRPLVTATSTSSALPSTSTITPPNFPSPIPTTWLCIAVPLSNITTYPIQPDTTIPPSLLESTFSHPQHGLPTKKLAQTSRLRLSFKEYPSSNFPPGHSFPSRKNLYPKHCTHCGFSLHRVPIPTIQVIPILCFRYRYPRIRDCYSGKHRSMQRRWE
ncbi:uncharacterized protein EAF02_002768 [Botrytis sinoallii]|uniref:uncharacterized protein n=1 Tax=Botrytis sinoallii TaxID=1463999 RepID=UPI0019021F23|nr:uncharacterized protein EAF02_002768 [Botrytis sinoallii]KAF7888227.1 hypothetical protein EAF02_002768 [Botrytis sinoallii]